MCESTPLSHYTGFGPNPYGNCRARSEGGTHGAEATWATRSNSMARKRTQWTARQTATRAVMGHTCRNAVPESREACHRRLGSECKAFVLQWGITHARRGALRSQGKNME